MTNDLELATLQTGLLDLIKGRATRRPQDKYLQLVADSDQLSVVQEIAYWWCEQTVTSLAPLTSRLLSRLGRLQAAITELSRRADLAPSRRGQAIQYLNGLDGDTNTLLSALANFEAQLLLVATTVIERPLITQWPCDPYAALHALLHALPLPAEDNCGTVHFTEVGSAIPDLFRVITTQQSSAGDEPTVSRGCATQFTPVRRISECRTQDS